MAEDRKAYMKGGSSAANTAATDYHTSQTKNLSSSGSSGIGGYTSIRDMFDGGGAGRSGDTFEGFLGGISNALGATPRGSDREPTGVAGFVSKATGLGSDRVNPAQAALLGLATGGLGGVATGLAGAYARNAIADQGGIGGLFGGLFGGQGDVTRVSGSMETSPRPQARPANLGQPTAYTTTYSPSANDGNRPAASNTGIAGVGGIGGTSKRESPLDMSAEAAKGQFSAIPNPDYDPTNPMSSRFLLNPTYEQLLAYRNYQLNPTGGAPSFTNMSTPLTMGMNYNPVQLVQPPVRMAEGGAVGGNEKSVISDAISAVKGNMPEEQAAMALGMFVQTYGKDALTDLVDRVRSGELDDTVNRSEGKLEGPGDGMNDRIPASIDGEQDVLLSDGEFIIPADVVSGLGNGSSDAGAKELERFMTRVRVERSGNAEQPDAVDPAKVLPV